MHTVMLLYFISAGGGHYYGLAHSTNQATSLTKLSLREMPAPASKMVECVSPMKSEETTCEGKVMLTSASLVMSPGKDMQ